MLLNLNYLNHKGVETLVREGIKVVRPDKVVLFGSRAKKNNRPVSDFDIAFFFSRSKLQKWRRFLWSITDSCETLFAIDWIDANTVSKEFKAQILKNGVTLYEAKR